MTIIDILYIILVILIAFILFNIGIAITFVLVIVLVLIYLMNLVRHIVYKSLDQIKFLDNKTTVIY